MPANLTHILVQGHQILQQDDADTHQGMPLFNVLMNDHMAGPDQ